MTIVIRVADHAPTPGGRFTRDGAYSGEWFRDEILRPMLGDAIASGERVSVVLDGTRGYGSSFLEEAFGGLIRTGAFSPEEVRATLTVVASNPVYQPYKILADRFIRNARRQLVAA